MEKHFDKHSEDFVKKIYGELDLEKPSLDFTDKLMHKIEALEQKTLTSYKPVISKPFRYVLGIGFIALVLFLSFNSNMQSPGWLDQIDWSFMPELTFGNSFGKMTLPKSIVYAIVLFGIMFWIQIGMLKQRHSNQFKV